MMAIKELVLERNLEMVPFYKFIGSKFVKTNKLGNLKKGRTASLQSNRSLQNKIGEAMKSTFKIPEVRKVN